MLHPYGRRTAAPHVRTILASCRPPGAAPFAFQGCGFRVSFKHILLIARVPHMPPLHAGFSRANFPKKTSSFRAEPSERGLVLSVSREGIPLRSPHLDAGSTKDCHLRALRGPPCPLRCAFDFHSPLATNHSPLYFLSLYPHSHAQHSTPQRRSQRPHRCHSR
jgi:hypothetical protein